MISSDYLMEEEKEDWSPSNSVWGEDETESDNQEEESSEDVAAANPIEGIENLGAPQQKLKLDHDWMLRQLKLKL